MHKLDVKEFAQRASTEVRHPVTQEKGYIYYLTQSGRYIFATTPSANQHTKLMKIPQAYASTKHTIIVHDKQCFQ